MELQIYGLYPNVAARESCGIPKDVNLLKLYIQVAFGGDHLPNSTRSVAHPPLNLWQVLRGMSLKGHEEETDGGVVNRKKTFFQLVQLRQKMFIKYL